MVTHPLILLSKDKNEEDVCSAVYTLFLYYSSYNKEVILLLAFTKENLAQAVCSCVTRYHAAVPAW